MPDRQKARSRSANAPMGPGTGPGRRVHKPPDKPDWMTRTAICQYLGVGTKQVDRYIKAGEFGEALVYENIAFYDPAAVEMVRAARSEDEVPLLQAALKDSLRTIADLVKVVSGPTTELLSAQSAELRAIREENMRLMSAHWEAQAKTTELMTQLAQMAVDREEHQHTLRMREEGLALVKGEIWPAIRSRMGEHKAVASLTLEQLHVFSEVVDEKQKVLLDEVIKQRVDALKKRAEKADIEELQRQLNKAGELEKPLWAAALKKKTNGATAPKKSPHDGEESRESPHD